VARKRRRSNYSRDFFGEDYIDGLEINTVNSARFIGRKSYSFSIFDDCNVCIEVKNKDGKSGYRRVSIQSEVRHANISKTRKMNGYKERIKGR